AVKVAILMTIVSVVAGTGFRLFPIANAHSVIGIAEREPMGACKRVLIVNTPPNKETEGFSIVYGVESSLVQNICGGSFDSELIGGAYKGAVLDLGAFWEPIKVFIVSERISKTAYGDLSANFIGRRLAH